MTPAALAFLVVNALALLVLPRRLALLPLLVGACYMTRAFTVDLGPFTFTILRLLVVVGLVRVALRGERLKGRFTTLDMLIVAWGLWVVGSVAFHENPGTQVIVRLRGLFDAWGMYFLFRVFCGTWDDVAQFARLAAVVIGPLAVLLLFEKMTGQNLFATFGMGEYAVVRDGTIRARGPFDHAILAGTVGAVFLPLCVGIWSMSRPRAVIGGVASIVIILSSGSSGPITAMVAAIGALCLWPLRTRVYVARWAAFFVYVALELVMNRPAIYLTTSMNFVGGSSGWYRARLIESAFYERLGEWWLTGTDYTRHWMPTGVAFSGDHTDITNHYIGQGVNGGLLLMFLFIGTLWTAFLAIGRAHRSEPQQSVQFLIWGVGASLFAHAVSCLSTSYYDQATFFLYMSLAMSGAAAAVVAAPIPKPVVTPPLTRHVRWNPAFQLRSARLAGNPRLGQAVNSQRRMTPS